MPNRTLDLLDNKLASGEARLTTRDVQEELGLSPQAASNLLARWRNAGLVDRVANGHYAIRQLGLLGTRAASEDISLAVGAFFGDEPHRIAYRSALDHHGLLTHPARTIQVACPREVTVRQLSGRPLRTVMEPRETISIGSEDSGHHARVSDVERALLDAASRLDLIGGAGILAEALAAADADPAVMQSLAGELRAAAGLRRIGSLADHLPVPRLAGHLEPLMPPASDISLNPRLEENRERSFRDGRWRVRWPEQPSRLAEQLRQ
ncbi:MAG: type IV toxin-antitoxin system AbiEi family antitoxin domain-containing protein [Solirubrobacteraceae bacterium]